MEEEEGIEESISVRLVGSDGDSKWVDGSEVNSEPPPCSLFDEDQSRDGNESMLRRLVKKPKRVDSFDAEAMGIAGSHAHHS